MDVVPDFARADPWRESLERSLARRGRSARSPADARPQPVRKRSSSVALTVSAIVALMVAAMASMAFDGRSPSVTAPAHSSAAAAGSPRAGAAHSRAASLVALRGCGPVARFAGYVDPLARAAVRAERIDQGVDYAGTGILVAIGPGRLTYVSTANTGWPGAFIEYELLAGPDAGCFVFYAEGVVPEPGMRAGQRVRTGQRLATIIPGYSTGIELGWGVGSGTTTYAAQTTGWTPDDDANNVATAAGKSFSALIASLGGPPGVVEG